MDWLIFALASASTFGTVTVLDKMLISHHVPNAKTFIVMVGIAQLSIALLIYPLTVNSSFTTTSISLSLLSGIVSGTYLIIMFSILASQEVSRVVPVVSTYPVFVALLALVFLGESVTGLAWVGILTTVVGAALVSLGPSKNPNMTKGTISALFLLLLASLAFGLSQFITKAISQEISLWHQLFWRNIGVSLTCGSLILLPGIYGNVKSLFRKPKSIVYIMGTEAVLVFFASLFLFLSIYSGEVYLTSTVMATRPLFVFVISMILSLPFIGIFEEPFKGQAMYIRTTGTVLTVGGIIAVSIL